MFQHAIVRRPCEQMVRGLTTAGLGNPKYDEALVQHDAYIDALISCGLTVSVLDADNEYPDSTFIEDVALCTPECAIVMRPGAKSRKGETKGIREVLEEFYTDVSRIREPGTVEAGDIMMVGKHYYVGKTTRTEAFGIKQLTEILEGHDMTVTVVEVNKLLHLKSGMAYLENNKLLLGEELYDNPLFDSFEKIRVGDNEEYAANAVWINDKVLVPDGFPLTQKRIEKAGYETIAVDVTEFRKLDGGLSCLSLRF